MMPPFPRSPARRRPLPGTLRLGAALAALVLARPALAAGTRRDSTLPVPAALQALTHSGTVKILSRFPTAVPGLTGFVVRYNGNTQIVYGQRDTLKA